MLFGQYIMRLTGEVTGIFDIVPRMDYRVEGAFQKDEERIKEALRVDREKNLFGPGVPDENSSLAEQLSRYIGGQMEIQNEREGYIYRGEVAETMVVDGTLMVRFAWIAKGEGSLPVVTGWTNDSNLDYSTTVDLFQVSDLGDGRMALDSNITGELVVFFPPDGSKLDPSQVVGLQLLA